MTIISADILLVPECLGIPQKGGFAVYSVRTGCYINAPEETAHKDIENYETVISYYRNINNTKWNLTIERVEYPNFIISIVKPFSNGTTLTESYEGNVESGNPDLRMWMVSPNLEIQDPIYKYSSDEDLPHIEDASTHEFANTTRDVVYTNFNRTEPNIISNLGIFWDRETGVLCGMLMRVQYYSRDLSEPVLLTTVNIKIVETNLWTDTSSKHKENSRYTIVATIIFLFISVGTAALYVKRKRKRLGR